MQIGAATAKEESQLLATFYDEWWTCQLGFKEVDNSGLIVIRSRVYRLDSSRQRSHLATTLDE